MKILFVPPVGLYRLIHRMHYLLCIPPACLIHVPIFNGGKLMDKYFVTSYYLHMRKLFIGGLMFFWFHLGRLGRVLCLNLLDCIKLVFVEDSALHSIALMACNCSVMQPLLLQNPCKCSKVKDHSHHLSRRLDLWKKGSFDELMNECRCIQKSTHPSWK